MLNRRKTCKYTETRLHTFIYSDDPKEMEFIQEQLVESLKVLDREESSHRALDMELNGARQQLLTSSVVHIEGSSSQNISGPIFKFEQLR